jgi:hypothetical protein
VVARISKTCSDAYCKGRFRFNDPCAQQSASTTRAAGGAAPDAALDAPAHAHDAGSNFYARCADQVEALAEAAQELGEGSQVPRSKVRVAAPADFFNWFRKGCPILACNDACGRFARERNSGAQQTERDCLSIRHRGSCGRDARTSRAGRYSTLLEKSQIAFVSKQMGVSVEGTFSRFRAEVAFNPHKPAGSAVALYIAWAARHLVCRKSTPNCRKRRGSMSRSMSLQDRRDAGEARGLRHHGCSNGFMRGRVKSRSAD